MGQGRRRGRSGHGRMGHERGRGEMKQGAVTGCIYKVVSANEGER